MKDNKKKDETYVFTKCAFVRSNFISPFYLPLLRGSWIFQITSFNVGCGGHLCGHSPLIVLSSEYATGSAILV